MDLKEEISSLTTTKTPTLDQYWEGLAAGVPVFSPEEQRTAIALYRELAKGQAVDVAQLAGALGVSPAEARALLGRDAIKAFVYPDDQGRILGFGGLAVAPMPWGIRGATNLALLLAVMM